jgi:hypothetical protein
VTLQVPFDSFFEVGGATSIKLSVITLQNIYIIHISNEEALIVIYEE